jgi:hypothetical protein
MDTDKLVNVWTISCQMPFHVTGINVEVNELDCRLDRTEMNLLASNMALRVAPMVFILQHGLSPYVLLSQQSQLHFFIQAGLVMPSNGQRNETYPLPPPPLPENKSVSNH